MAPKHLNKGRLFKQKEENMEETKNVFPFQVIDGGLKTGAKEPPADDWLTRMTPGTVFLTVPKIGFEPAAAKMTVKGHAEGEGGESVVELQQEGAPEFWVLALRFCQKMRCVAVLARGLDD